ncbi:MAG: hypothetical protein Q7T82_08550 [Armatimonadota bacterium]|nr:hypothetical protein [Armatimonadota bacterium]
MFQIILVVWATLYLRKRGVLQRLTIEDFPTVSSDMFDEWRRLEVQSLEYFAWTVLGATALSIVGVVLAVLTSPSGSNSPWVVIWGLLVPPVSWLVGAVLAVVPGTRAQRIKKSAGIIWPK